MYYHSNVRVDRILYTTVLEETKLKKQWLSVTHLQWSVLSVWSQEQFLWHRSTIFFAALLCAIYTSWKPFVTYQVSVLLTESPPKCTKQFFLYINAILCTTCFPTVVVFLMVLFCNDLLPSTAAECQLPSVTSSSDPLEEKPRNHHEWHKNRHTSTD